MIASKTKSWKRGLKELKEKPGLDFTSFSKLWKEKNMKCRVLHILVEGKQNYNMIF